jgi:hypothetical protein
MVLQYVADEITVYSDDMAVSWRQAGAGRAAAVMAAAICARGCCWGTHAVAARCLPGSAGSTLFFRSTNAI